MFADYLVGKNPLERERHWSEIKRALRKYDRTGIEPVDIVLWDFAGKYHDAPIHELLGTYQTRFPVYAGLRRPARQRRRRGLCAGTRGPRLGRLLRLGLHRGQRYG